MADTPTIAPVPPDVNYLTPGKKDDKDVKTLLLNAKTTVQNEYVQASNNYLTPHVEVAKAIGGPT